MNGWTEDIISVEEAQTLAGLFQERVRRTPDAVAYRSYDKSRETWRDTSWREMADEVARWQAALEQEGLQPGDRVAISLRNCKEWVIFDQAALGLGLVVVPLYPDDRPDSVGYILSDAAVKLLLLPDYARWKRLASALASCPTLERVLILEAASAVAEAGCDGRLRCVPEWLPDGPVELQNRAEDPNRLASIVYTSGTTGRPKGVMLSHRNMLWNAHAALQMVKAYREDVFLSFLPLSHTLERTGGYYFPMMAGSTVAYARSIPQLAEDMKTVQPTVLIAVPRIFERIYARIHEQMARKRAPARWLFQTTLRVGWARFEAGQGRARRNPLLAAWSPLDRLVASRIRAGFGGRLRIAVSGGAALPPQVGRLFIAMGITVLQGYGLTETSPVVSVNVPEDNDPASVGLPLPGLEVRIGAKDELQVRSPGVMLGYWNNHVATAAMIDPDGWLRTGDQARIEHGHIYITGRIKDVLVLSNGEKVPPGDMEAAIAMDPLFEQVMVIGEGKPYLAALLVLNADLWFGLAQDLGLDPFDRANLNNERLHGHIIARLARLLGGFPSYAKIRRAILSLDPWTVDDGLLTPTLKVKRNQVLAHYAAQIERLYEDGPA
ncbi:MAG: long-chain fatty acid--CoA ligase [Gammaproteobacteria bacterium]